MGQFQNKVVLVTGGTSGIGQATAVAFAKEGAKVVISGRREKEGNETVRQIGNAGGEALFVKGDVSKAADVDAMVRKAVEAYGRIDYAFANAGILGNPKPFLEETDEEIDRVTNINIKGVILTIKYVAQQMLKQGGGVIINNASVLGFTGLPTLNPYVASKHAVIGLTKSAALEFAKSRIRVNAVAPGPIDTDMPKQATGGDTSQFDALVPMGRMGRPDEIAEAVLWLCSDRASYVTGHTLTVDGGYTAQ